MIGYAEWKIDNGELTNLRRFGLLEGSELVTFGEYVANQVFEYLEG